MILDPEKTVADYTDDEQRDLVEQVRADFVAAENNRDEREEIALEDYELYARKRRDAAKMAEERGGWSQIEVPIVYWNVEHQVPRLGVEPPTVTVKALTPQAVPYSQAKQLRLQHYLYECGWDRPYQMIARSKLILGDGIAMVPWSPARHMPRVMHVDWFDFFVSHEATVFEEAEVQFARTFWTKRGLEELDGDVDANGDRLWHNLDELDGQTRGSLDDTWERRRAIASQGSGHAAAGDDGVETPFISCWYRTGEFVVLGGSDHQTLVRAGMSPYRRRLRSGGIEWIRPFVFFRNIPDLTGPYSLSEANVLGDHQIEMSTLRNQNIDQISMNQNAPVVHDESIPDELVAAAFASPKGRLAVPWGASGPLIMRMPPGQISGDMSIVYDQIRNEAQLISGVNDNAAGQPVNTQQTATEVSILSQEANRRIQLKRKMDEIAMAEVGRRFDWLDRQYGGVVNAEVPSGFRPGEGARGFTPVGPGGPPSVIDLMAGRGPGGAAFDSGFVEIGTDVNGPHLDYQVEIEAGSAVRADQGEEAQKLNAFLAGASHPLIAPLIDPMELARAYVLAHGMNPDRILRPPNMQPVGPDGQPLPLGPDGQPIPAEGPAPTAA